MSGMDRLTIDDLQYWEEYGYYDVKLMARELLAHRRASQAAPAPSDALREALERIAEEQMYRSGYDQTDISVEPVLSASEMQEIARAALSALTPAPAQEGGE